MASSSTSRAPTPTPTDSSDSLDEEHDIPSAPKKSKYTGAYKYKTKFSADWKKSWQFISSVPGNPHQFRCNICAKVLSCAHQGVADVKAHIAKQSHQTLAKQSQTQSQLSFSSSDTLRDKVGFKQSY